MLKFLEKLDGLVSPAECTAKFYDKQLKNLEE